MKTNSNQISSLLGIEHPSHSVPEEIMATLTSVRGTQIAAESRQSEIARQARPTREEEIAITESREAYAIANGIKAEIISKLRDIRRRKADRVREIITKEVDRKSAFTLPVLDTKPPQPGPTDPTFWWARTDWWHPGHFSANLRNDGLHFYGGVTTHDGDLHFNSFGAVALFELQASRIPMSLSRRWISTPHIELFGGVLGYTGNDDIFTGDLWSKCWVHRDQQLFQWGFGENGPVPIVLGQGHDSENLVFEENADRPVNIGLRGFQFMPPVAITNVNPSSSIWARLEIRFDIQTEGAGSLLWLDPEVLLRTFQWPLSPL